ncbi:MAG: DUF1489 family protein [Alphaproteobacteria bacterium]
MTIHLLKLCVGADSIDDLSRWQKGRLRLVGEIAHTTRMVPKRRDEVLDGGSIYWVIKGFIQVRQRLVDIRPFTDEAGIGRCDLLMDPELVAVDTVPRRPFQGWRYLKPEDAPADVKPGSGEAAMPAALKAELRELGLL